MRSNANSSSSMFEAVSKLPGTGSRRVPQVRPSAAPVVIERIRSNVASGGTARGETDPDRGHTRDAQPVRDPARRVLRGAADLLRRRATARTTPSASVISTSGSRGATVPCCTRRCAGCARRSRAARRRARSAPGTDRSRPGTRLVRQLVAGPLQRSPVVGVHSVVRWRSPGPRLQPASEPSSQGRPGHVRRVVAGEPAQCDVQLHGVASPEQAGRAGRSPRRRGRPGGSVVRRLCDSSNSSSTSPTRLVLRQETNPSIPPLGSGARRRRARAAVAGAGRRGRAPTPRPAAPRLRARPARLHGAAGRGPGAASGPPDGRPHCATGPVGDPQRAHDGAGDDEDRHGDAEGLVVPGASA